MRGRARVIAFLFGVAWIHTRSSLIPAFWWWSVCAAVLVLIGLLKGRHTYVVKCLSLLACFAIGAAYVTTLANWRLAEQIPLADINKLSKVQLRITSLVRLRPDSRQFHAQILQSQPTGLPSNMLVHWSSPGRKSPYAKAQHHDFPELKPGQIWSMSLLVKPVHGARNPHGFDYEQHLFAQGIRGLGSVRGQPEYLRDDPGWSLAVWAERLRYLVRSKMLLYVSDYRYGGVLLALAMGDQASISPDDWELFNRAGLTHLVSISGAHVTFMAVLLAAAVSYLWRRCRWRGRLCAERYPAQYVASWTALCSAFAYCVLAGWGVPAQRTFLMLLVVVLMRLSGMSLGASRVLLCAAGIVVLWDPWALLSSGFYLSFAAVAVLLWREYWQGMSLRVYKGWRRFVQGLYHAACLQLLITVALFPFLAYLFHEISLVSPLTNAYAIPLIGSVLTPLSLLLALLAVLPGGAWAAAGVAYVAANLLEWIMLLTQYLIRLKWALMVAAAAPFWTVLWALLGVVLLCLPRGWMPRLGALLMMLPVLFFRPSLPAYGEWQLNALDVGQGTAVVLRTHSQVLVYDAGVRYSPDSDEGLRTIVPYLRSQGIKNMDVLVLSHADLDHVGGASSLLQKYSVTQSWAGFDLQAFVAREERLLQRPACAVPLPLTMGLCQRGVTWQIDGVRFEFLWPTQIETDTQAQWFGQQKNSQSCVLSVRGKYHSALLLGDIGVKEEEHLLLAGLAAHDVVLVGHHGSRSSSSQTFVKAVQAKIAIAQNGHWNRFSHPDKVVQARWTSANALFFRSDHDGAVQVDSHSDALWFQTERERHRRYWQLTYPSSIAG